MASGWLVISLRNAPMESRLRLLMVVGRSTAMATPGTTAFNTRMSSVFRRAWSAWAACLACARSLPLVSLEVHPAGFLRPPRSCLAPVALVRLPFALILRMVEIRMGTPYARSICLMGSRRSGKSLHRVGRTMSTALRMGAGLRAWWRAGVMRPLVRPPPVSLAPTPLVRLSSRPARLVPTPLVTLSRPAHIVLVVLVAHPPVPVLSAARVGASVGRGRPMARFVFFLLVILVTQFSGGRRFGAARLGLARVVGSRPLEHGVWADTLFKLGCLSLACV